MNLQAPRVGVKKENKMIKKLIHELVADLATPAAMRAVPTLLELAEFDEFASDVDQIRQMLNALDKIFEDADCYFALVGGHMRNQAMTAVCRVRYTLENRIENILSDPRGHYFPCEEVIDGPGLYQFITVGGFTSQTLIAEDSVLAAITFGA